MNHARMRELDEQFEDEITFIAVIMYKGLPYPKITYIKATDKLDASMKLAEKYLDIPGFKILDINFT